VPRFPVAQALLPVSVFAEPAQPRMTALQKHPQARVLCYETQSEIKS
jgi:hypothetical protein